MGRERGADDTYPISRSKVGMTKEGKGDTINISVCVWTVIPVS